MVTPLSLLYLAARSVKGSYSPDNILISRDAIPQHVRRNSTWVFLYKGISYRLAKLCRTESYRLDKLCRTERGNHMVITFTTSPTSAYARSPLENCTDKFPSSTCIIC